MKRFLSIYLFLLVSVFVNCRKCVSCKAVQNVGTQTIESPYEKFCGTSKEVEDYENGLKNNVPDFIDIICESN